MTSNDHYQRMAQLVAKQNIHRLFRPDALSIIPEIKFRANLKILDVGCRNGRLIFALASFLNNYEFHGLDINAKYIQKNEAKNKFPNVKFHYAQAEELPFSNEYFDIVICTNALHRFPQRVRALDEMFRVLKIGGELFLLEGFNGGDWKNKFDKILRQSKFIHPEKKFLPRTALFKKSYLVHFRKES